MPRSCRPYPSPARSVLERVGGGVVVLADAALHCDGVAENAVPESVVALGGRCKAGGCMVGGRNRPGRSFWHRLNSPLHVEVCSQHAPKQPFQGGLRSSPGGGPTLYGLFHTVTRMTASSVPDRISCGRSSAGAHVRTEGVQQGRAAASAQAGHELCRTRVKRVAACPPHAVHLLEGVGASGGRGLDAQAALQRLQHRRLAAAVGAADEGDMLQSRDGGWAA